jgi:ribosomal subunit interface protein
MSISIKAKNLTLSPAISDYVDTRIKKILAIAGNDPTLHCDVELSRTTRHHEKGDIFRAEIHITGAGIDLYAASEKPDLYIAIDDVRDEITRELNTTKGKRISLIRRSGARAKAIVKGFWSWKK